MNRTMSTGWWSSAVCYLTGLRVVMILTLLAVMNGAALAGDFVLNYAIDADGKTDTGKLENCDYEQICEIRATGLIIEIVVRPRTTGLPTMDMSVLGPSGCCYTAGVVKQFHSTLAPDLLRVPLYRRAMRERDEFVRTPFVRNERLGMIYLEFFHLH